LRRRSLERPPRLTKRTTMRTASNSRARPRTDHRADRDDHRDQSGEVTAHPRAHPFTSFLLDAYLWGSWWRWGESHLRSELCFRLPDCPWCSRATGRSSGSTARHHEFAWSSRTGPVVADALSKMARLRNASTASRPRPPARRAVRAPAAHAHRAPRGMVQDARDRILPASQEDPCLAR